MIRKHASSRVTVASLSTWPYPIPALAYLIIRQCWMCDLPVTAVTKALAEVLRSAAQMAVLKSEQQAVRLLAAAWRIVAYLQWAELNVADSCTGACLLPAHVLQLRTHGELDIQVRSGTRSMCSLYSLDIYGDWELPRVLYGFSNTRHDRVYLQFCRLCELMEYAVLCRKQSYARLIIELHYDQIIMSGLVKWADGTQHRLQQGPTLVPRQ